MRYNTGAIRFVTGRMQKLGVGKLNFAALKAAKVNPKTGLATDYLNHFNEASMLLEMAVDTHQMADELLEWVPCDYEQHFEDTNYQGKEIAINAWRAAPHVKKAHFQTLINALNAIIGDAQEKIRAGDVKSAVGLRVSYVEPLLAAARACINGHVEAENMDDSSADQASVDRMFQKAQSA